MAVNFLEGKNILSLSVITKSPVRTTLDYRVVQRFGMETDNFGEEVVPLPHCTRPKADRLCRHSNADLELQKETGKLFAAAGTSCGVSEFDPDNPVSPDQLIEAADQDMYKNKLAQRGATD